MKLYTLLAFIPSKSKVNIMILTIKQYEKYLETVDESPEVPVPNSFWELKIIPNF